MEEYAARNSTLLEKGELVLYPELHEKMLESIEEHDTTIRKVALSILDKIVTRESFPKVAETLIHMSRNHGNSDEYIRTFLSMAELNEYSMIEDFGWYLLSLADLAKSPNSKYSAHAQTVADQFVDITGRVEAVRGYAVSVAHILIIGGGDSDAEASATGNAEGQSGLATVAPCILQSLSWIIGEHHKYFEESKSFVDLVELLVSPAINSLPPSTSVALLWAGIKLFCGYSEREDVTEEQVRTT